MKQNNSTKLSGYVFYNIYHKNDKKCNNSPIFVLMIFPMIFRGILVKPQYKIDMATCLKQFGLYRFKKWGNVGLDDFSINPAKHVNPFFPI